MTVFVLFDFKLAFNSICHIFLLAQAPKFNFDDNFLMFLYNFLIDRFINVEGSYLTLCCCEIGQRTGPAGVLFIIVISSAANAVQYCDVDLFAAEVLPRQKSQILTSSQTIDFINFDICNKSWFGHQPLGLV